MAARLTAALCVASAGLAAAFALGLTVPVGAQLGLLAVGVAVLGMPHGAVDHITLRPALERRFGGRWYLVFHAAYAGGIAAVLLGWWAWPAGTVALFFGLSALHFGLDDSLDPTPRPAAVRLAVAAVAGGVAVFFPILADPTYVAASVDWILIAPSESLPAGWADRVAAWVLWGLVPAWLLLCGWHAAAGRAWESARLACLGCLLLAAPPLVGFGVYFCFWHSWRAMGRIRAAVGRLSPALPLTALTVAAAAGAAWVFQGRPEPAPRLTQALFLTLSAVAVPHMLLHWWLGERTDTGGDESSANRLP